MAVNPTFAVTCLTCSSRLKVADPSLIGSIANCPKCGAMVEIKPPEGVSQPHLDVGPRSGIDSEAITQSSIGHPDSIQATAAELDASGNPEPFPLGDTTNPDDPAAPPISGPPVALPVDPAEAWQSESSRRTRQVGLVVTLGGFCLLAAMIAFVQFARSFGDKADSATVAAVETQPSPDSRSESTQPESEQPAPETQPAAPDTSDENSDSSPESTATDREPADSNDDRNRAPVDTDIDDRSSAGISDRPTETTTADEPIAAADPADPVTPPASDDAIAARPATRGADAGGEAGSLDDLPAGLRRFVPLLDMSTSGGGPPQVFEPPPTIESIRLDSAANDLSDEAPAAKRPSVDISKVLTMRLAIDQQGATLNELTLLVSQLTAIPVELELISLDLAGVSTTASPRTPAGWMPIGQWLDQTLAEIGLVTEIDQGRILVTASPETILAASGSALQLDDFGDRVGEVVGWVRPVVGPLQVTPADAEPIEQDAATTREVADEKDAEDGWVWDAAESRLRVPAERSALVRTILAVEAARMIQGLPPRLPRWQTDRWMGRWSQADAARRGDADQLIGDWPLVVDGPTGPQYDSPRPLAGWLREFASENRVAIVVAWQDAMRHQVFPDDSELPLIEGLDIGEVLDELIGGAGLQARDTGDSVWWIGSEGNYDRYEVITWVTITPGSGEAVARRLAEALGVDDLTQLTLSWDETTLLVRAPRYIARQLSRFAEP